MRRHVIIRASWDDENALWFIEESDISGLFTEAPTLEALYQRIRDMIPDLLESSTDKPDELEIDLIAHKHERVKTAA